MDVIMRQSRLWETYCHPPHGTIILPDDGLSSVSVGCLLCQGNLDTLLPLPAEILQERQGDDAPIDAALQHCRILYLIFRV